MLARPEPFGSRTTPLAERGNVAHAVFLATAYVKSLSTRKRVVKRWTDEGGTMPQYSTAISDETIKARVECQEPGVSESVAPGSSIRAR